MATSTKVITLLLLFIVGFVAVIVVFDREGRIANFLREGSQINFIEEGENLPVIGKAPELEGIQGWVNTEPLSLEALRGKVVLIDFWTYSCINCIRTFPYLSQWQEKYKDKGFVLLGVHSPEFEFEKKQENVEAAAKKYGLAYPIALDNNHETWRAFNNNYWPEHWLLDGEGNIRLHTVGEGHYAETEKAIQSLLIEEGLLAREEIPSTQDESFDTIGLAQIATPEIYLGYLRMNNAGSKTQGIGPGERHLFPEPEKVQSNRFYFVGEWKIEKEYAEFTGNGGKLLIRYKASKLNMVLETKDQKNRRLELKLDGAYLTESNKGDDVILEDGRSYVEVNESRLYNLVDTGSEYEWRTLEIIIPEPGILAFTFTFG